MTLRMRLLHGAFNLLNRYLMLPLFDRMGGPRDSVLGGRLCVLRTVGRRSGQIRDIPLNYAPTTAGIAVLAGFGRSTAWVHNLRARPQAEVLIGATRHQVQAIELSHRPDTLRVTRAVMTNAGAAGFCCGWDPRRASEDAIGAVAEQVVCFHLRYVDQVSPALAA